MSLSTSPVKVSNKRKLTPDDHVSHPRKHLRIEIPSTIPTQITATPSATTSHSSLFSATSLFTNASEDTTSPSIPISRNPALRTVPPIPGLYFTPALELPAELAESITSFCMSTYFKNPAVNQVMLFTRFSPKSPSSLPPVLIDLLNTLSTLLKSHIPESTHNLLFPTTPTQARQVILNLYTPGEGISPHVDLLKRFGDGIIGVSLGSGCVMRFAKASGSEIGDSGPTRTSFLDEPPPPVDAPSTSSEEAENNDDLYDLYLPERSILVLCSDARYKWTHGIEKRKSDFVAHPTSRSLNGSPLSTSSPSSGARWIGRGTRLSVTFRWLLPGADIVGADEESSSENECESTASP